MAVVNLPTYIPLSEAARRYRLGRKALTRLVESGRIRAVSVNGDVAVAEEDVNIVAITEKAQQAGDQLVSISEAARKLKLNSGIVWWWYKHGWLPERGRGPNRAIFVSLQRARALASLRAKRGRQGRRLIPKGMDVEEAVT